MKLTFPSRGTCTSECGRLPDGHLVCVIMSMYGDNKNVLKDKPQADMILLCHISFCAVLN
jgi:hypothetical protein